MERQPEQYPESDVPQLGVVVSQFLEQSLDDELDLGVQLRAGDGLQVEVQGGQLKQLDARLHHVDIPVLYRPEHGLQQGVVEPGLGVFAL
jgi:hypothetical protein